MIKPDFSYHFRGIDAHCHVYLAYRGILDITIFTQRVCGLQTRSILQKDKLNDTRNSSLLHLFRRLARTSSAAEQVRRHICNQHFTAC
jgi:hypothetical protein